MMNDMDYVLHSFGFGLYMLEKVGVDPSTDEKGQREALESSGVEPKALLPDPSNRSRVYVIATEGRVPCALELEAFAQNLKEMNEAILAAPTNELADAFTLRLSEFRAAALLRAT